MSRQHRAIPDLSNVPTGALVNGQWISGHTQFEVLDKFTSQPIAQVAKLDGDAANRAISILQKAAAGSIPDPQARSNCLNKAALLLENHRERLVTVLIAEAGFTAVDANNEIDRAKVTLQLSAQTALRLHGEMVPFAASPGAHRRIGFTQRFPIGIVCAITPFNSPLNVVLHKVAPAYAAGNAVILKPSPFTPLTANILGEILLEAGMPPEFLAVVHGSDDSLGATLLHNPAIGFYTFTGSTRVGRLIQAAAGLRKTQMELGSIASTIVCADADLDHALPKIVNAGFRKAGQVCTSVQRLYVQRDVVAAVQERLIQAAQSLIAGDPQLASTHVGPLISRDAAERSEKWVKEAVQNGAILQCGGTREGSVFTPTVLTDVPETTAVWCQEAFAPMLSIRAFDTIDEVIINANNTPFGLSAGVFTQDIDQALKMAQQLRFGGIHINEASSARADVMPFGGVKESGFGREGPDYAAVEMSEERLITFNPKH
ncbi:aldehyde dehydrogenase family protein [Orrella sp. 11846]|uniref:aldehyde dehydrogenase family protein n=1 Tax=Orrella sp. 11846 TaxID=3409913 RepID=UPI003B5C8E89